jgi:exodeoxyribonuclease-1
MNTIFWHDYETFGAEPQRDRPAQFAGVRTDENLNIIGPPVTLFCRPAPDFLPQPEACLITGITPQRALREGVAEAEFAARIHAELAAPGTCGAGYNSVRFDDEVTRFLLYRNLFPPYDREWRNGNSRWDIIDLARMAYALRPEGLNWPLREDATPSFRLEDLSAANGLAHESAHDALSDVYATIALARKIRECQPRLYDFLYQLRDKRKAGDLLNLNQPEPVLHTTRMYPAQYGCTSIVAPLAADAQNKNAVIVFDLRYDPEPLLELSAEEIRARMFTATDKLPAGVERIALKNVLLNKCPALAPLKTLTDAAAQRLQLDVAACLANWQKLQSVPAKPLAAKIQQAFAAGEFPPYPEAEAALYQGFIGDGDRAKLDRARGLTPAELAACRPPFQDARLPDLLFRYRARNYPEILDPQEQQAWRGYCQARLINPAAGASMVAEAYFAKLQELRRKAPPEQQEILDALEQYGRDILK